VGFGAFLRREDIERLPHSNLAQVLQRTRGMAIHYRGARQFIYFTRYGPPHIVSNVRGPPINACMPRVFLDGNRMTYDGLNDINSIVSPDQVEAIETYVAGNAPVEYTGGNSGCGVVLIWTRHEQ